jgi:tetratricopeptide (TPR) repeat protein
MQPDRTRAVLGSYTEFTPMWRTALILLASTGALQFQRHVEEAQTALERKDFSAAQRSLEQATRLDPKSAPAWFLLAQAYLAQGKPQAALSAAAKAGQFSGDNTTILYNLALFYLEANRPADAIAAGKRVLAREKTYEVRSLLARAYEASEDWPNAMAEYEEARRLSPYSEEAIFNLAQAHMKAQDFPRAIAVLLDGRKVFDKSPQLELALGVAYYGQRRFADAVDRFLRVMELAPGIPQPYYFMGRVIEHAVDRIPEVIARARAFEQANPQSPLGYVLHARALILEIPPSGFPPEAEEAQVLLQKALAIRDDQADAHYLLGTLLERKQDYSGAALQFETAIRLNAADPAPHFRLARVYERLGRREDAQRERALHEKLSAESGAQKPPLPAAVK